MLSITSYVYCHDASDMIPGRLPAGSSKGSERFIAANCTFGSESTMAAPALAYRPPGHEFKGGKRARATGDYEPWTPN